MNNAEGLGLVAEQMSWTTNWSLGLVDIRTSLAKLSPRAAGRAIADMFACLDFQKTAQKEVALIQQNPKISIHDFESSKNIPKNANSVCISFAT